MNEPNPPAGSQPPDASRDRVEQRFEIERGSPRSGWSQGTGIALGIAIGAGLGVAFHQLAIGIGAGVALGAALDAWQKRRERK